MSLVQSCTQCRYEALPYFWQNTVFHLLYYDMRSLMRHISKSMRDQIRVVHPSSDLAWQLEVGVGTPKKRSFSGVLKVIMVYGHLFDNEMDVLTKRVKRVFGKDAELVYPDGESYA